MHFIYLVDLYSNTVEQVLLIPPFENEKIWRSKKLNNIPQIIYNQLMLLNKAIVLFFRFHIMLLLYIFPPPNPLRFDSFFSASKCYLFYQ